MGTINGSYPNYTLYGAWLGATPTTGVGGSGYQILNGANFSVYGTASITGGTGTTGSYLSGNGYYAYGGGSGVYINGAGHTNTPTLTNHGSITGGTGGPSPQYHGQGYPFYGGRGGIGVDSHGPATLYNFGTITGGHGGSNYAPGALPFSSGGIGVLLDGGTLTNETSGSISSGYGGPNAAVGVVLQAGLLTNDGQIGGARGVLQEAGTLLNNGYINSAWLNGGTLLNNGYLGGGVLNGGTLLNNGHIGGVTLDGGTLTTSGTIAGGVNFSLCPTCTVHESTLVVDPGAVFNGAISSFELGDTVDITYLTPSQVAADFNATTHVLSTAGGTLDFSGTFSFENFVFSSDGGTGTDITLAPVPPTITGSYPNYTLYGPWLGATGTTNGTGAGGEGGSGYQILNGANVTVYGTARITGGTGGYGSRPYYGGNGGSGVYINGAGHTPTLTNHGSIIGGAGGGKGTNVWNPPPQSGGCGGIGVDSQGPATLYNFGTITGGEYGNPTNASSYGGGGIGVDLNGSTLTNETSGSITGGYGLLPGSGVVQQAGMLTNDGHIIGGAASNIGYPGASGVILDGGTLLSSGYITGGNGYFGGAGVVQQAGMLTNNGHITGGGAFGNGNGHAPGGSGVNLNGGTLINNGYITGGAGYANGGAGVNLNGGMLTTSGTISGSAAAPAVQFGTVASTLVLDPGAVFNGQILANAAVNDVLELSGTQAGGTPITLGSQFTNFSTLQFLSGAAWTVAAGTGAAPGSGLTISGFTTSDTIDITNLTPTQVAADLNPTTDVLTTTDGTLTFSGVSGDYFVFTADGRTGTNVTLGVGAGISTTVNTSVTLGSATQASALTITSTGVVAPTVAGATGVALNDGTLKTSGSISGGTGAAGTYGSAGTVGDAVQFGTVASTLIVNPGALFNGLVAANAAVNDTLKLSGIQAGGTAITLGTQFTNFSTLLFLPGALWTVDASTGAASSSPGISVAGFAPGDQLDFTNLTPAQLMADFNAATDVLATSDGTLHFTGSFSGKSFVFSSDGSGGSEIGVVKGAGISTTINASVTLGSTAYPSPLTITNIGTVVAPSYAGATGVFSNLAGNSLTNGGAIHGGSGSNGTTSAGLGGAGSVFQGGVLSNGGQITGGAGGSASAGTGGTGGAGVTRAAGKTTNSGSIAGGAGGTGSTLGGAGGVGVNLASGGTLTNTGSISGGSGASGGTHGGHGGAGVFLGGGTLITSGTLSGGAGGSGPANGVAGNALQFGTLSSTLVVDPGAVFNGALGGFGLSDTIDMTNLTPTQVAADFNPTSDVLTTTSDGTLSFAGNFSADYFVFTSDGGSGSDVRLAAGAGISTTINASVTLGSTAQPSPLTITNTGVVAPTVAGASGLLSSIAGNSLTNAGAIHGGSGSSGSVGGAGGLGMNFTATGTVTNSGSITGGTGGSGSAGAGGAGGAGINLLAGTVTNSSSISGGTGGSGSTTGGAGGTGVFLNGGTLITSGSVSGGAGGSGPTSGALGAAVQFGTVASSLVLDPGAVFNGQLLANASVNDVLELSGTQAGGSAITLGTQFMNFSTLQFLTGSAWTVAASTGAAPSGGLAISGFTSSDTIDVTNLTPTQVAADFNPTTEVLTTASDGTLHFGGGFSGDYFVFTADGGTGTNVRLAIGSGISTPINTSVTLGSTAHPSPLTITNTGVVAPTVAGAVGLLSSIAGNSLTNNGTIHGAAGGNASVGGAGGLGVNFAAAGTLINTGGITGGSGGAGSAGAGGAGGAGVRLVSGATLTSTGSIAGGAGGTGSTIGGAGGAGVFLAGGTLITSGSVSGGAGGSGATRGTVGAPVQFGAVASTLVLDPGAVLNGSIAANAAVHDVLELAGAEHGGTAITLGAQFTNFSALQFAPGAAWTVRAGPGAASSGGLAISGFASSDVLDITNLTPTQVAADFNPATEVLTTASDGTLHFTGTFTNEYFMFTGDGGTGTAVRLAIGSGISTTINTSVTLGSTAHPSPLTITATGIVAPTGAGAVGLLSSIAGNSLTNNGAIHGAAGGNASVGGGGGLGVNFTAAGTLINTGSITGGTGGSGSAGSGGAGGAGVRFVSAATLTNTGSITGGSGGTGSTGNKGGAGGVGVSLNGGTLSTSGTISGGAGGTGATSGAAGHAVNFGTAASTLIVDPGAVFNGLVAANASVNDVLELSGTQAGGTAITLGTQFTGFSTLDFAAGASGTVDATKAALTPHMLTIDGFGLGDTLDITNLATTGSSASFNASTEILSITNGATLIQLGFDSAFTGEHFVLTANGLGTNLTLATGAAAPALRAYGFSSPHWIEHGGAHGASLVCKA